MSDPASRASDELDDVGNDVSEGFTIEKRLFTIRHGTLVHQFETSHAKLIFLTDFI